MKDDVANHYNILIISENSSIVTELSQQLVEKDYKTFNAPPFADLKYLDTEHPVLIVIVDCPDTCVSITEYLRLSSGISDIPIICMSDRVCSVKPSHSEQICIGKSLPESSAFDALESRIRFCLHQHTLGAKMLSEPLSQERRHFERRQPVNLTEQTQATHQLPPLTSVGF